MAHLYRFFVPGGMAEGAVVELPDEERHHALRVARVKVGEVVSLFDGTGREYSGAVTYTERRAVGVKITHVSEPDASPTRLTIIAAALHKEKSTATLIRRCTELGVTTFRFFKAARSERLPKRSNKWEKAAIESCKQCGRLRLPLFEVHSSLQEAVDASDAPILVATPDHEPIPIRKALGGALAASVVVGPEGGLTPEEVHLAMASGALPISLGHSILRAEVAASMATALVQYELGALGPTDSHPRNP